MDNSLELLQQLLAMTDPWQVLAGLAAAALGYYLRYARERAQLNYQHQLKITELLTEKLHEYAVKYHMPIVTAARSYVGALELILKQNQGNLKKTLSGEHVEHSLHRLVLLLARNEAARRGAGSIFLRDLTGEGVISVLFSQITDELEEMKIMTRRQRTLLAETVDPTVAGDEFSKLVKSSPAIEVLAEYRKWLEAGFFKIKPFKTLVSTYGSVFLYEVNAGHEAWYKRRDKLDLDSDEKAVFCESLSKLQENGNFTPRQIRRYRRKCFGWGFRRDK